jgi:hypothetical protein
LGFAGVPASAMFALRMSILPWNTLRGVRSRGESCANAVRVSVNAIVEATALEIAFALKYVEFM